jgi:hypothetical protein
MVRWTIVRRVTLAALAAAFTACSEPTAPPPSARPLTLLSDLGKSGLIVCPTETSESASALLTAEGGEVSIAGYRVIVPANALPLEGVFHITLRVPASKYVEVDIRVNGLPHFAFAQPITVVMDYSRCTRSDIDRTPLRVWYIDPLTNVFLRDMGGVDDKVARTVTFTTDHFSGYAVAQ